MLLPALACGAPAYGPELQGFDYPHPVASCEFSSQGQDMYMAYRDVQSRRADHATGARALRARAAKELQ